MNKNIIPLLIAKIGNYENNRFVFVPKLPKSISEGIKFGGCCPTNATLNYISVSDNLKVKVFFTGYYNGVKMNFDFTLDELELYKSELYKSLINNIYSVSNIYIG